MSIAIDTATSEELLNLIGNPVEIDIAPMSGKKSDTSVTGNVLSIDPETRSMVLVQFQKGNTSHLVYVPGTSIQEVYDLAEGPFDDDNLLYVKNTPELREMIAKQFRQQKTETMVEVDEIEQRKSRLLAKFEYSCIQHEVTDEGQTIIVGAVKIRSPFGIDNCFSENQLALGKVRQLVESIFDGTPV
uniref:AD domain-containing protein n=1 Tax=Panagrolaimus sp. JU765 TaxID=591449 RepID=A0AC34RE94_9BILA